MQGLNRVLRRVLMALMAVTMFTQCRVAESSVAMRDVSIDGWTEPVTVSYNNTDPTSLRDLNVTLHINRHFTASDIALEITTLTPDSLRYTESITLPVQTKWPSNNTMAIDVELPYRRDVHFSHEGEYSIILRPLQNLQGVEAAGINFQTKR